MTLTVGGILQAVLVSERYGAMTARAAEYGNDRILMGAHSTMDVLGGRTLATYDLPICSRMIPPTWAERCAARPWSLTSRPPSRWPAPT